MKIYIKISMYCIFMNTIEKIACKGIRREGLEPPILDSALKGVQDLTSLDPEWNMTTAEIISYHGYPAEEHQVLTDDGYILTLQRIPHGKQKYYGKKRNPVIIQHGLFATSSIWVFNIPEKNLAYKLADAGYDVWLANIRGTTYSKKHLLLTPENDDFWRFSFDEMGKFDMPAIIDFVLKKGKSKQVDYIGHSMGTLILSITLSMMPEYNKKVRLAGFLAPALSLKYTTAIGFELLVFRPYIEAMIMKLSGMELHLNSKHLKDAIILLCEKLECKNIVPNCLGQNVRHNMTRIPVYGSHFPDTTSTQTLLHYLQLSSKSLQMYDYGKNNFKIYNQNLPPKYNLSTITTPICIFWSDADPFANPIAISDLIPRLPSLVFEYRVPHDRFKHEDYFIANDADELVYNKLLAVFENFSSDNQSSTNEKVSPNSNVANLIIPINNALIFFMTTIFINIM